MHPVQKISFTPECLQFRKQKLEHGRISKLTFQSRSARYSPSPYFSGLAALAVLKGITKLPAGFASRRLDFYQVLPGLSSMIHFCTGRAPSWVVRIVRRSQFSERSGLCLRSVSVCYRACGGEPARHQPMNSSQPEVLARAECDFLSGTSCGNRPPGVLDSDMV